MFYSLQMPQVMRIGVASGGGGRGMAIRLPIRFARGVGGVAPVASRAWGAGSGTGTRVVLGSCPSGRSGSSTQQSGSPQQGEVSLSSASWSDPQQGKSISAASEHGQTTSAAAGSSVPRRKMRRRMVLVRTMDLGILAVVGSVRKQSIEVGERTMWPQGMSSGRRGRGCGEIFDCVLGLPVLWFRRDADQPTP